MRGRGGSLSSPPCVVEWIGGDGGIRVAVDDEDVRTVRGVLGAVPVPVHVVLDVEALHVLVEGADVLLRGFNDGHRFISSMIRLARSSPLMSPDQYWCSTASTFSSGRVGSVRAAITAWARTSVAIGSSGYRARIASATR